MPKQRHWTPAEDAIVRENAHLGPSWEGYALLLPGRTKAAIMARRKYLGVAFDSHRGRPRADGEWSKPKPKPEPKPLPTGDPWTREQDEALLLCAKAMVEQTGHSTAECAARLREIIRAYRNGEIRTERGD